MISKIVCFFFGEVCGVIGMVVAACLVASGERGETIDRDGRKERVPRDVRDMFEEDQANREGD